MDEHRDVWWKSPAMEHGRVTALPLAEPFRCRMGGELPSIQICWEEWGRRSAAGDNTVLVIHPMTADCHVTGAFDGGEPGWWEELVGPGRAIDTNRFHVVCPNHVGGCYGSTGPRFPAPEDGAPYLDRFPLVTPRDLVRVHRLFLDAIQVDRPALVIGPSMGGMVAWEWAATEARAGERVIVVAAPLVTTPLQIAWNWLQRTAVDLDLAGDGTVTGKAGQRIARGVGMLSYRSPEGLLEKFGRETFQPVGATLGKPGLFNMESWLKQHGNRIAKKYDPWTWKVFARTMDLHDLGEGIDGGMDAAAANVRGDVLALGIRSDCLYPAADVRQGVERVKAAGGSASYAEIDSEHGHDAFLIETDAIASILGAWLGADAAWK